MLKNIVLVKVEFRTIFVGRPHVCRVLPNKIDIDRLPRTLRLNICVYKQRFYSPPWVAVMNSLDLSDGQIFVAMQWRNGHFLKAMRYHRY